MVICVLHHDGKHVSKPPHPFLTSGCSLKTAAALQAKDRFRLNLLARFPWLKDVLRSEIWPRQINFRQGISAGRKLLTLLTKIVSLCQVGWILVLLSRFAQLSHQKNLSCSIYCISGAYIRANNLFQKEVNKGLEWLKEQEDVFPAG